MLMIIDTHHQNSYMVETQSKVSVKTKSNFD